NPHPRAADGRGDPRAQPAGQDVSDRRAQHAARPRSMRPDPRAGARSVHLPGGAGGDPAGRAGPRPLLGRRLQARRVGPSGGEPVTAMLELRGVIAGYGAGDVLQGVDLDTERGSVTCVVGPNGAGKSTVLRAVSGLLRPREGTIAFEGNDIRDASPPEILGLGISQV